jgi:adenylyl cyclase-associated protein
MLLLQGLLEYVKEYYKCGITWNNIKGVPVSEFKPVSQPENKSVETTSSPESASVGVTAKGEALPQQNPVGQGNLFAELNKGGSITSGLKTVTKDMQTWRKEYKGDAAPAPLVKSTSTSNNASKEIVKGNPKVEFQEIGSKWNVENIANKEEVINITSHKETVYIYGCINATITISGKCKSVIIDSCKRSKVYVGNVMASVEIVNAQRMQLFCSEKISSVAIDKTDGIVVHLPASSLDSTIVASKSSEMNISWPGGADGEVIERPIPEQYVHRVDDNRTGVTANVSDLYTH